MSINVFKKVQHNHLTPVPIGLHISAESELNLLLGGIETLEAAYYWYNGDGNMVKSEVNGVVSRETGTIQSFFGANANQNEVQSNLRGN